ncbi:MAG: hypothetical protein FJ150_10725 [Euryarchaeota archaeon]|nr:hypothetical protein [Euryarchaeota archaeon]
MIEKIEVSMMNENIHNYKKGEFGVKSIDINYQKAIIEIKYGSQEGGIRKVLIPLENIEKCDYIEKTGEIKVNIGSKGDLLDKL